MKLSELSTDKAADIMIQIAADIEILANDDVLVDKFVSRKTTKDKNKATKLGLITILDIAGYLLKEHRETAWNIIGALNEKTAEEIGEQLFPVTLKQMADILNDKDFRNFFTLSAQ